MNDLSTQLGVAAIIGIVIQAAKKSPYFPLISVETEKLNRLAVILASGLGTLGIAVHCDWSIHSCTANGLDWHTVAPGLWHWFTQAFYAHFGYKIYKLTNVASGK